MNQEIGNYIVMVIGVAVVYGLCVFSALKLVFSKGKNPLLVKRALLSGGLFTASIILCLFIADMLSAGIAAINALVAAVGSFALFGLLSRKWSRDAASQEKTLIELQNTVKYLGESLSLANTPEALCAKIAKDYELTRREEDMLLLLSKGLSYADISDSLYLSQNTVKTHVRNLYKKVGVSDRDTLKDLVDGGVNTRNIRAGRDEGVEGVS